MFKFVFTIFLSVLYQTYANPEIDRLMTDYVQSDESNRTELLLEIAQKYQAVSADSTLKYSELALKHSQSFGNKIQIASALNYKGFANQIRGDYVAALQSYQDAIKIIGEDSKEYDILAYSYKGLGDINRFLEASYDEALNDYIKAYELYSKTDLTKEKINTLKSLGDLYLDLKDPITSLKYYNDALEISKNSGDTENMAITNHIIGKVTMMTGESEKGLRHSMSALSVAESNGYKLTEAMIRTDLADMYTLQGDTRRARSFHIIALNLNMEYGNILGSLRNLQGISHSFFFERNIEKSIEYGQRMIDLASENNINKASINEIYSLLSRAYENNGQHEQALRYYKIFNSLQDEIFNREKSRQIAALQVAHETQKKENEIKELMVKEQKSLILFTTIVGILILVIAVIFFFLYRQKKKIAAALEIAKVEAEKADRLKTQILSNMTHEIKTPLNFINSSSMLLKMEVNGGMSDDAREAFEGLNSGVTRLNRTVDLYMTLASVKSGNYVASKQNLDLSEIINEIFVDYKLTAEKENKNVLMVYENNMENCLIESDITSLNVIINNIVDNAVKFTTEGSITVRTYKNDKNQCTIEIEDTGVGISEEYIESIFEPFTQEEMDISRSYDGNGLGLALAKEFCNIVDAELTVESIKGKGSKFTVTLN